MEAERPFLTQHFTGKKTHFQIIKSPTDQCEHACSLVERAQPRRRGPRHLSVGDLGLGLRLGLGLGLELGLVLGLELV